MPRTLRPCPSCARHVRPEEETCPFCDAAIPPCSGACATTTSDGRVTYRAAIVFATAAAAVATGACGKEKREPDPVVVQPYGAPPIPVDASASVAEPTPVDAAGAAPVAVYGPPPVQMNKK